MSNILIETIRVTDGEFNLLPLHLRRMEGACRELFGKSAPELRSSELTVPDEFSKGTVKCRVTYDTAIRSVEFERYTPRQVRSMRLVEDDTIDYHLKYADRSRLNAIRERRGEADEVLIVRDGLVTDTSYSNVVFCAGDRLLTPSRPLLNGVMRQHLLASGMVKEAGIAPYMLLPGNASGITGVILINAMLPLGTVPPIPLECVTGI